MDKVFKVQGIFSDIITSLLRVAGLTSLLLLLGCFIGTGIASASVPVLFFSDLTSGPNAGWSGPTDNSQGAAVSIWGENFGASGTINIGGQTLASSNSSQVAEWGTTGTANGIPRGLQRITFWLNSAMTIGSTTISVTSNGITSNSLPFRIRALGSNHIYFISVNTGNNSNTGYLASPWKDIFKASPYNTSSVIAGDIIYVMGGTYTQTDSGTSGAYMNFTNCYGAGGACSGSASMPFVLAAYPGEFPELTTDASIYTGEEFYWTISKLKFTGGSTRIEVYGQNDNIIGNWFNNITCPSNHCWVGMIDSGWGDSITMNGNYFYQVGSAAANSGEYFHNIYFSCAWGNPNNVNTTCSYVWIGWNEFDHPVNGDSHGGVIDLRTACLGGNCNAPMHHIYVHDNYFHDGPDEPLYQSNEGGPVQYVYFYNNISSNMSSTEGGLAIIQADANSLYANNTFYLPAASTTPILNINTSVAYFKNNIFYGYSGQPTFSLINGGGLNSTNDLYYNVSVPSGSGVTVTGAVTANPEFISTSTPNFHLQASSPAINAGISISPIATTDYDGLSRGTDYAIGAYQYSIAPSPPTALSVH